MIAMLLVVVMIGCKDDDDPGVHPTVGSTNPENGATGVAFNHMIVATFAEPMDQTTFTTSTFTLKQGSTVVPGAVGYIGTTATFKPAVAL